MIEGTRFAVENSVVKEMPTYLDEEIEIFERGRRKDRKCFPMGTPCHLKKSCWNVSWCSTMLSIKGSAMCNTSCGSKGMYITFTNKQIRQNPLWLWNPEETSPETGVPVAPKKGHVRFYTVLFFSFPFKFSVATDIDSIELDATRVSRLNAYEAGEAV